MGDRYKLVVGTDSVNLNDKSEPIMPKIILQLIKDNSQNLGEDIVKNLLKIHQEKPGATAYKKRIDATDIQKKIKYSYQKTLPKGISHGGKKEDFTIPMYYVSKILAHYGITNLDNVNITKALLVPIRRPFHTRKATSKNGYWTPDYDEYCDGYSCLYGYYNPVLYFKHWVFKTYGSPLAYIKYVMADTNSAMMESEEVVKVWEASDRKGIIPDTPIKVNDKILVEDLKNNRGGVEHTAWAQPASCAPFMTYEFVLENGSHCTAYGKDFSIDPPMPSSRKINRSDEPYAYSYNWWSDWWQHGWVKPLHMYSGYGYIGNITFMYPEPTSDLYKNLFDLSFIYIEYVLPGSTKKRYVTIDKDNPLFAPFADSAERMMQAYAGTTATQDTTKDGILPMCLRHENKSVKDSDPDMYATLKSTCKKAFSEDLVDPCLKSIEESPSVKEIDDAILSFSVSQSTISKAGQKYLAEFIIQHTSSFNGAEIAWKTDKSAATYDVKLKLGGCNSFYMQTPPYMRNHPEVETYIMAGDGFCFGRYHTAWNGYGVDATYRLRGIANRKGGFWEESRGDCSTSVPLEVDKYITTDTYRKCVRNSLTSHQFFLPSSGFGTAYRDPWRAFWSRQIHRINSKQIGWDVIPKTLQELLAKPFPAWSEEQTGNFKTCCKNGVDEYIYTGRQNTHARAIGDLGYYPENHFHRCTTNIEAATNWEANLFAYKAGKLPYGNGGQHTGFYWPWGHNVHLPHLCSDSTASNAPDGLYIFKRVPDSADIVEVFFLDYAYLINGTIYDHHNKNQPYTVCPLQYAVRSDYPQELRVSALKDILNFKAKYPYSRDAYCGSEYVEGKTLMQNYYDNIEKLLKKTPSNGEFYTLEDLSEEGVTTNPWTLPKYQSLMSFPMDIKVLNEIPIAQRYQLSQECFNLFFNYYKWYKIPKKKWYQRGIFKIFTAIIGVVITIVTKGAGAPLVKLLLISVAVMAAVQIVSVVLVNMFGKFGAILAFLVSAVASCITGSGGVTLSGIMQSAQSIITNPAVWMNLASSIISSITQAIQESLIAVLKQMQELSRYLEEQQLKLEEAYKNLDKGNNWYMSIWTSPSEFLTYNDYYHAESRDEFLSRTLMLGGDNVESSLNQIHNFVDGSLNLDNLRI